MLLLHLVRVKVKGSIISSPSTFLSIPSPVSLSFLSIFSHSSMAATEESLRKTLAEKQSAVESQGNAVRALKAAATATKSEIDAAVEALNAMQLEKSSVERQLQALIKENIEKHLEEKLNTADFVCWLQHLQTCGGVDRDDEDVYFDDDSAEVVISSLRLSDDQGRFYYQEEKRSTKVPYLER